MMPEEGPTETPLGENPWWELACTLRDMYVALLSVGFTEQQALQLAMTWMFVTLGSIKV